MSKTIQRRSMTWPRNPGQAEGTAGISLLRGREIQRATARQLDARAVEHAKTEPDGGTDESPIRAN